MVETTTDPKTYDFAGKIEDIKTTEVEVVKTLPIVSEDPTTILLSVERNIKTLLEKLSSKEEIGWNIDIDPEEFSHLPNSITGVIIYYVLRGIKDDFQLEFEKEPKSLKRRGISKEARKIAGKKRLLTKEEKNELLEKTQMSFYESKIASGEITIEDAMNSIKDAFQQKQKFEEIGYILPTQKSKSPFWVGEEKPKRKTSEKKAPTTDPSKTSQQDGNAPAGGH